MARRSTPAIMSRCRLPGHDNFQDSNTFITAGGQRGPQKDILLPGTYYVNPLLFKVILESAKEVSPGEVAVIVSNVGKDPVGGNKAGDGRERSANVSNRKRNSR